MTVLLFKELKRRNVFKVGVAYLVLAWVVVQVTQAAVPALNMPEWINTAVFFFGMIGFPFAIFFAWAFEITPDGVKKEADVNRQESVALATGRKIDLVIIALLTLALAYFIINDSATVIQQENESSEDTTTINNTPTQSEAALVRGVAVLPFENMSSNTDNAYFASGVHEDILTNLSAIQEFRVISRTSVKIYQGTSLQIPDIAKELGVSHIVEGSVRRAGNKVRVTVQLIDGATDEHIWAENYDRDLDDIFAIQSEIAKNIVTHIKDKLTSKELASINAVPTVNRQAYDLYLKARSVHHKSVRSQTILVEPIEQLKQALVIDPTFVKGWVELVQLCSLMVWWDNFDAQNCAEQSLKKLAELAPGSPELTFSEGIYLYRVKRDYLNALTKFERASAELPNNESILSFIGFAARRNSMWSTAIEALRKAVLLSPNNISIHEDYIFTIIASGNWQYALKMASEAIIRFPKSPIMFFLHANLQRGYLGIEENYALALKQLTVEQRLNFGNIYIESAFCSDKERMQWIEEISNVSPFSHLRIKAVKAMLLLFDNKTQQSKKLFKSSHNDLMTLLGEDWKKVNSIMLSVVAMNAALADNTELALQAIDAYWAHPLIDTDRIARIESGKFIALAYAVLGKDDLAWKEIVKMIETPSLMTAWDLKQDLRMQHFFGKRKEYQAIVAKLTPGT